MYYPNRGSISALTLYSYPRVFGYWSGNSFWSTAATIIPPALHAGDKHLVAENGLLRDDNCGR